MRLIETPIDSAREQRHMATNISKVYGSLVFNDKVMKERLPKPVYKSLHQTIAEGSPLDDDLANTVAHAMKEWAVENGCTHFTHWFQPLTGGTSEKHDAFISPVGDGTAITAFSGKELIQGEPDASSFPSGGLRQTASARGYTAWDPTSYAFIKDEVLCIPTVFISYTGEALDKKTPLLRSMKAISDQAKRVLACFGIDDVPQVVTTVGAEQEYFLIKLEDYAARPDLVLIGRTLFGAAPAKGQELDEHYFGAVRETVSDYMKEVDTELWKLGIDARTKHNEVAPAQHEIAPIFARSTTAIDNNLLTMEILRKCAPHHGLYCLIREKPFEGVNGSGKHNNWSLATPDMNLLAPGKDPAHNTIFLLTLAAVIQAVDDYQQLLRATVATAGNDLRLGANEAPPAIVSIFLGDELESVRQAIVNGDSLQSAGEVLMDLGSDVLPHLAQDTTDRNRTSPFAFTGNRFEFRMPGSSVNLSSCNTVINAAVAKSFKEYADILEKADDAEAAALDICKRVFKEHERIIFNGNGYSAEWEEEAARRGLANNKNTPDAMGAYIEPDNIALFEEFGVMTEAETRARYDVKLGIYAKMLNIEALTMLDMASKQILPAVLAYSGDVASTAATKASVSSAISIKAESTLLDKLSAGADAISQGIADLEAARNEASEVQGDADQAKAYRDKVLPAMAELRKAADSMELVVAKDYWPFPTYNDMLFYV